MDLQRKTKSCETSGGPSAKRRKLGVGPSSARGTKRQISNNADAGPPPKKIRFLYGDDDDDDDNDDDVLIVNIDIETVLELESMLLSLAI
jgi:hypothetical protein